MRPSKRKSLYGNRDMEKLYTSLIMDMVSSVPLATCLEGRLWNLCPDSEKDLPPSSGAFRCLSGEHPHITTMGLGRGGSGCEEEVIWQGVDGFALLMLRQSRGSGRQETYVLTSAL